MHFCVLDQLKNVIATVDLFTICFLYNEITRIQDESGQMDTSETQIMGVFVRYHKTLYRDPSNEETVDITVHPRPSE